MLIDHKSGELLGRTNEEKGQTTIFNGYANPKMLAIKKVTKNQLLDLIKKHIYDSPAEYHQLVKTFKNRLY